jgi:enediyne biosynthesis protein E4
MRKLACLRQARPFLDSAHAEAYSRCLNLVSGEWGVVAVNLLPLTTHQPPLSTMRPVMTSRVGVLLLACCYGCERADPAPAHQEQPQGPAWFQDITDKVGLRFTHDAGRVDGKYFLPQIIGSGGALFDFDNDGRLDVLLLQNGGPASQSRNRLFRQGADGRFLDVSAGSGLDFPGHCMGVAIGDVNNDGWPDVLITQYRGVKLFLNNGNGTFTDVTREAGLENPLWGTSAAFVDYDRDGWLDLVVVNYLDYDPAARCAAAGGQPDYCHPSDFRGTVTKLYHNLGEKRGARGEGRGARDEGRGTTSGKPYPLAPVPSPLAPRPSPLVPRFEDVTLRSGLGRLPGPGLGVVCADFDGDGWPDILVANDDKPNHLWINQHDGTFKEQALVRGVALCASGHAQGNMGIALGDVAGAGLFDLFITHLTEETHTLWLQKPRGMFQDRTVEAGLTNSRWRGTGFGTVLADFDHDGALDLAVVNGRVSRGRPAGNEALSEHWSDYAERNQLFANDGAGRFRDIAAQNGDFCGAAAVSRGLACGDIDGDGAVDLLVTAVAGPARLYRNIAPKNGHWLLVRAIDPALHRDAYGAEITIQAGGRRRLGWINPGQSYLCSHDPRAHFGLGAAERVDAIRVHWPDGAFESFPGCGTDQQIVLRKGEGTIRRSSIDKSVSGRLTEKDE